MMKKSKHVYLAPMSLIVDLEAESMVATSPTGSTTEGNNQGPDVEGEAPNPGTEAEVRWQGVMDNMW